MTYSTYNSSYKSELKTLITVVHTLLFIIHHSLPRQLYFNLIETIIHSEDMIRGRGEKSVTDMI